MSFLKGLKIDDIENVTVIIFDHIHLREKKIDERLHITMHEPGTDGETLVEMQNGDSIAMSSTVNDIDVLLDFPNRKSIDNFINYLSYVRDKYYK